MVPVTKMNYYNEFDKNAAEWLRELIAEKLIPYGDVDERSITDIRADDFRGYTQCHFFAGIGGWSLALQLAGWPEDRPVWTGSCPCQPYSTAGKQQGNKDERDLWPEFFRLIKQCKPEFVFGEQVENAIRHGWLDRVYSDLEGEAYTVGASVLGAHSVGSPHRRYRLYWGGVSMAENPVSWRCGRRTDGNTPRYIGEIQTSRLGCTSSMANSIIKRLERFSRNEGNCKESGWNKESSSRSTSESCTPSISPWNNFELIFCRDGKTRRIPAESILFSMVDGVSKRVDRSRIESISETEGFPITTQTEGRVMLLKGYGNAIVPQVASEFIKAFVDILK